MKKRERMIGLFLALPSILGLIIFIIIPFLLTIYYSFTIGIGARTFGGFKNYIKIYKNEMFQLAFGNTVKFMVIGIPLIMILSFLIAVILHRKIIGSKVFRLSFLFPLMVPVASTVMIVEIFLAKNGILNFTLIQIGVPIQDWLGSRWAFWILILLYLWKNIGYNIILMCAGLQMIPDAYDQSAMLDGAGSFRRLWHITLPLIRPTLFFTLVISILNSFKSFREAFLIGGAHPDDSIYLLQHFMNNNFENLNYPRLAVAAVTVFAVIFLVVTILYIIQNIHEKRGGGIE